MTEHETPYDKSIEAIRELHGDLLSEYHLCDPDSKERIILSGQCTQAKVILDVLIMMKEQYENNI